MEKELESDIDVSKCHLDVSELVIFPSLSLNLSMNMNFMY